MFYVDSACVVLSAAVVAALLMLPAAEAAEYEDLVSRMLVGGDSVWRYYGVDGWPGDGWYMPGFDDSGWLSGVGYFSTESGGASTVLPGGRGGYSTYYFRTTFSVENRSYVRGVSLNVDYEDAYIVYVNGRPVVSSDQVASTPEDVAGKVVKVREATGYHVYLSLIHI